VADTVSFIVQLVDKVSGPARAAAASTAGLGAAAQGAKHALDAIATSRWAQVAGAQAQKAMRDMDRFSREAAADIERINRATAMAKQPSLGRAGDWMGMLKANTALGAIGRVRAGLSGMVQSVRLFGSAWDAESRRMAGASFTESLGVFKQSGAELLSMAGTLGGPVLGAVTAVGGALLSVAKYAGLAAAAGAGVGVALSGAFAKAVGEMALLKENTVATFNALTGGKGAESFEQIRSTAAEMAVPIKDASEGIRALTAAGFKGEAAFQWFKRMQDLSAIGVTGETMSRVVLAMSQIKGAGQLQGDELRQLQETGLNIDLIWQSISKQMGVSVEQAKKMKEQGKVSADVALAGIESAIAAMTGATEAGGARIKWLSTTTQGAWEQLKAAGSLAMLRVAEAAKPAFERIKPVLDDISAWFRSDDATRWGERAAQYFSFLVDTAQTAWGVLKAFASGFGAAFGTAFDQLAKGGSPFDALKDPTVIRKVEDVGASVGAFVGQVLEATVKVTELGTSISLWMSDNRTTIDTVKIALMAVATSIGLIAASALAAGAVLSAPFIMMAAAVAAVIGAIQSAVNWVRELGAAAAQVPGIGILGGAAAGFATGGLPGAAAGAIAAFQEGGPVKHTAPAVVHQGEFVVPRQGAQIAGMAGATVVPAGPELRLIQGGASRSVASQGAHVARMAGTAMAPPGPELRLIQGGVAAANQGEKLRAFANGGPVDATGPAILHQEEFVVPKDGALVLRGGGGGGRGSTTLNVTFNITQQKGEDGEALARRVYSMWQAWWESQALAEAV
jgi:tape measure domain-containing protein